MNSTQYYSLEQLTEQIDARHSQMKKDIEQAKEQIKQQQYGQNQTSQKAHPDAIFFHVPFPLD